MIYRVFSDMPSFKTLTFGPGLNVLVAEKSDDATRQQTRNRAGKSSLVQLIRFLSDGKKRIFGQPPLDEYWFGMEFDLGGRRIAVERSGAPRSKIRLDAHVYDWPTSVDELGRAQIASTAWATLLSEYWFGLTPSKEPWTPKLGSLRAYFMRSAGGDGGFLAPTRHFRRQALADEQVSLAYLLGLDWTIARDWQAVRGQENALKVMRRGLKDGALGQAFETAAELDSQIVIESNRVHQLRLQLADFRVVDEYHALEAEAAELTQRLGNLADGNTVDRQYLQRLDAALAAEAPTVIDNLDAVYARAGIALPNLVQHRFDDVARFHEAVVANRQSYLQDERAAAVRRLDERDAEQRHLDARRAEIMVILKASGALEHFTGLQTEVARVAGRLEVLNEKHALAQSVETGTLEQTARRAELQARLLRDLGARRDVREAAILLFEQISQALYGAEGSGRLVFSTTSNGLRVETHIQGSRSGGVTSMQIFCFDLMLTILNQRRGRGPGFLIHDSHLFDGVDKRQVATALALGARYASEEGFQYIVMLNTDDMPAPHEYPPGFEIDPYIMDVRLSDATEDGGLFGIRFES